MHIHRVQFPPVQVSN